MSAEKALHHGGHRGHGGSNLCVPTTEPPRPPCPPWWIVSALSALWCAPLPAQQPPPAPTPPVPTFRSGTRLIVQTVTVKDKDGKPIEGLTAKDFTVTEDGEPQTIRFVEFQRLEEILKTAPPVVHTPANVKV